MVLRAILSMLAAILPLLGCCSSTEKKGEWTPSKATADVDLSQPPVWMRRALIRGLVADGQGAVSGALLSLDQLVGESRWPRGTATSDKQGGFGFDKLPAGAYALTCKKSGRGAQQVFIWVDEGQNQLAPFDLKPSVVISGEVADDHNRPLAGAELKAIPSAGSRGVEVVSRTDASGKFVLDGLLHGLYTVRASAPGHRMSLSKEIRAPRRTLKMRLIKLFTLEGTVQGGGNGQVKASIRIVGSGLWPGRTLPVASDGSFAIKRVPAGVYDLVAHSTKMPWLASEVQSGIRLGPDPPQPLKLELKPAQRITGVVVVGQEPVAGAMITLGAENLSMLRLKAQSDEKGHFELEPVVLGKVMIGVWARGYLPLTDRPLELPAALPLKLELNKGASLEGLVVDPDGFLVSDALVKAVYRADKDSKYGIGRIGELGVVPGPVPPIPPAGMRISATIGDWGLPLSKAITDRSGAFRLAGLYPDGQVQVWVEHPLYAQTRSHWITLRDTETINVGQLTLKPAAELWGRVLDERGTYISGVRVTVTTSTEHRTTVSQADGSYRFHGLLGRVVVSASHRGFLPDITRLNLQSKSRRELDLVLIPARGTLSGFVVDRNGLPIHGARIVASIGGHVIKGGTDPSGYFQLDGVGKRRIQIKVSHSHYLPHDQLASPGQQLEVRLEYPAVVEGRIQEQRTGVPVERFKIVAGEVEVAVNDTWGRFRLEGLRSGRQTIRVHAKGYALRIQNVEIARPRHMGEVVLDNLVISLARSGAIHGRVTAGGSPLARIQVRAAGARTKTDNDGMFKLEGVPEGSHVVDVMTSGGEVLRSDPIVVRPDETTGPIRLDF